MAEEEVQRRRMSLLSTVYDGMRSAYNTLPRIEDLRCPSEESVPFQNPAATGVLLDDRWEQIFFAHVPKTGGSTLRTIIWRSCLGDGVNPPEGEDGHVSHTFLYPNFNDNLRMNDIQRSDVPGRLIFGHQVNRDVITQTRLSGDRPHVFVFMMRQPMPWLLSWYEAWMKHTSDIEIPSKRQWILSTNATAVDLNFREHAYVACESYVSHVISKSALTRKICGGLDAASFRPQVADEDKGESEKEEHTRPQQHTKHDEEQAIPFLRRKDYYSIRGNVRTEIWRCGTVVLLTERWSESLVLLQRTLGAPCKPIEDPSWDFEYVQNSDGDNEVKRKYFDDSTAPLPMLKELAKHAIGPMQMVYDEAALRFQEQLREFVVDE